MSACARIRAVLDRLVESEASPEESLAAARHLADCTVCRIRLARARRLAEMLEHDLTDPVSVDEEFVAAVMRSLPDSPPPTLRRRVLRLMRLGILAGLALLPLRAATFVEALGGLDRFGRPGAGSSAASSAAFADIGFQLDALPPIVALVAAGVPDMSRLIWIKAVIPLTLLGLGAVGCVVVGGCLAHLALQRFSGA